MSRRLDVNEPVIEPGALESKAAPTGDGAGRRVNAVTNTGLTHE